MRISPTLANANCIKHPLDRNLVSSTERFWVAFDNIFLVHDGFGCNILCTIILFRFPKISFLECFSRRWSCRRFKSSSLWFHNSHNARCLHYRCISNWLENFLCFGWTNFRNKFDDNFPCMLLRFRRSPNTKVSTLFYRGSSLDSYYILLFQIPVEDRSGLDFYSFWILQYDAGIN